MWVLVIVFISAFPHPTELKPNGVRLVTANKEECLQLKEHIQSTWKFDRYRATVSCTFLGHY